METYIIPVLTALISYFGARHQSKSELLKVKEQQSADLQRLRETQNAEIQKIREQSKHQIEKIRVEMEKQAELYEKNAQTDMTKEVIQQLIKGDSTGLASLLKLSEQVDKGTFGTRQKKSNRRR